MDSGEALLLFSKLRDEGTKVFFVAQFFAFGLMLHGRVVVVSKGEVEIVSADRDCGVRFSLLATGLTFEYREPRDFPAFAEELPEEARTAMALVIEFPVRGGTDFIERLTVIEVLPSKSPE